MAYLSFTLPLPYEKKKKAFSFEFPQQFICASMPFITVICPNRIDFLRAGASLAPKSQHLYIVS